ncbi:MAG: hypothetical protein JSR66_03200 [Proteobacteria bacterium]|nr:hypothetical protein [Pseudomonadota bacterium]
MSQAATVTKVKPATVTTTKGGRRFVVCPGCRVIGAPVPMGADTYTCKQCFVETVRLSFRKVVA